MKQISYVYLLVASGLVSCAGQADLVAPPTSENLAVTTHWYTTRPDEPTPIVRISGGAGSVRVVVTRTAMCATIVRAGLSRSPSELAIVTRVSGDPTANCIAMESYIDYSGTITELTSGSYRVRVFEGEGDREPKFIGSANVTVAGL